jgi:hypothetical protein
MLKLEASADEPMPPGELVEPPLGVSAEAAGIAPAPTARPGAAPIAEVPKRASNAPSRRRGGVRAADVFVAVLALVVLALSLLGLAWVLRAD